MQTLVIDTYPTNKEHYLKLLAFAKEVVEKLRAEGIGPVLWGGLAYFAYSRDESYNVSDMDLLIPEKQLSLALRTLKESPWTVDYIDGWDSIVVRKSQLRVELDPLERYCKSRDFALASFPSLSLSIPIVSLDELVAIYKRAAERSEDKPEAHRAKWERLKRKVS